MQSLSLKQTVLFSLLFHVILLIFLSLIIRNNLFDKINRPTTVNVTVSMDSVNAGISQSVEDEKNLLSPHLNQRKTQSSSPSLPAKTVPVPPQKITADKGVNELRSKLKNTISPEKALKQQKQRVQNNSSRKIENQIDKSLDKYLAEDEKKQTQKQTQNKNIDKLDRDLDSILNENNNGKSPSKISSKDPLYDADWSAQPRKTLFFPNIVASIPDEYKKKGQNYAVKMRITFDKNGLAIRTELLQSSGDPGIDSIFMTELRKIRIEPIKANREDQIVKTFTISVK